MHLVLYKLFICRYISHCSLFGVVQTFQTQIYISLLTLWCCCTNFLDVDIYLTAHYLVLYKLFRRRYISHCSLFGVVQTFQTQIYISLLTIWCCCTNFLDVDIYLTAHYLVLLYKLFRCRYISHCSLFGVVQTFQTQIYISLLTIWCCCTNFLDVDIYLTAHYLVLLYKLFRCRYISHCSLFGVVQTFQTQIYISHCSLFGVEQTFQTQIYISLLTFQTQIYISLLTFQMQIYISLLTIWCCCTNFLDVDIYLTAHYLVLLYKLFRRRYISHCSLFGVVVQTFQMQIYISLLTIWCCTNFLDVDIYLTAHYLVLLYKLFRCRYISHCSLFGVVVQTFQMQIYISLLTIWCCTNFLDVDIYLTAHFLDVDIYLTAHYLVLYKLFRRRYISHCSLFGVVVQTFQMQIYISLLTIWCCCTNFLDVDIYLTAHYLVLNKLFRRRYISHCSLFRCRYISHCSLFGVVQTFQTQIYISLLTIWCCCTNFLDVDIYLTAHYLVLYKLFRRRYIYLTAHYLVLNKLFRRRYISHCSLFRCRYISHCSLFGVVVQTFQMQIYISLLTIWCCTNFLDVDIHLTAHYLVLLYKLFRRRYISHCSLFRCRYISHCSLFGVVVQTFQMQIYISLLTIWRCCTNFLDVDIYLTAHYLVLLYKLFRCRYISHCSLFGVVVQTFQMQIYISLLTIWC